MQLLLNEKPLLVLPALAVKIGLNESIVLQQLQYWLKKSTHFIDGHYWVYNTYAAWKEQFPFWSDKTIRRIIQKLETEGYIITGNFNKIQSDRTKWYRIDFGALNALAAPCGQSDQSMRSICPVHVVNMTPPLPEITTEITTEITNTLKDNPCPVEKSSIDKTEDEKVKKIPYAEIIEYLNKKANRNFNSKTEEHRKYIRALFKEDFTKEDFFRVIDTKVRQWLDSPKYDEFLRPRTLFAPKHFDNYLNEGDKNATFGTDTSKYDFTKELPPDF